MLNPVGRYGWSLHNDTLRPSLLGHAAARKAHTLEKSADGDDDPDEAPRSAETKAKQHQALGTLWNGDVSAHAAALDEVITSWRKDNAAGGRGVFEHLPLPNDLARSMARIFDEMDEGEKQPAFDGVISQLDPSVRTHVAQQVAGSMRRIPQNDAYRSPQVGNGSFNEQLGVGGALNQAAAGGNANERKSRLMFARDLEEARDTKNDAPGGPGAVAALANPKPREDLAPLDSGADSEQLTSGQRTKKSDDQERIGDYNAGDVGKTVDEAVAAASWWDRVAGRAGMKVQGKGRYVLTRAGWVDLQHVISAATATDDPALNLVLGVITEAGQSVVPRYWSSAWKKEDLLSNWIGASALARQRLVGGTIGEAVAHVLKRLGPMSQAEAAKQIGP